MSTYAIGDIQGCFASLEKLLAQIEFDAASDTLWFTGDLVNRGPQSLETLRFIRALGAKHQTVLGNHDLHLLAVAYGVSKMCAGDTFAEILVASDRAELIDWLRCCPLLVHDAKLKFCMVHAGIAPQWNLSQALQLASEVETVLRGDSLRQFLKHMYGNQPNQWREDLSGMDRLRCITNYFTRMRLCYVDGSLELSYKGKIEDKPDELVPWFLVPNRNNTNDKIIFGHWAALGGLTHVANVYALDTGCVWGRCLTALRLEDEMRFSAPC